MNKTKIIAIASHKGGTGKTTIETACITTLARMGYKCLVADFDSNLSLTQIFGKVNHSPTTVDLLNGDKIEPIKTDYENIWIIPSDLKIFRMSSLPEKTLKKRLANQDLSMFDFLFLDPPGTLNAMTSTVICAADQVIIPAMPSMIDFEATGLVFEELEMMDVEADIDIVMNGNDPKKNVDDIYSKFLTEYPDFFYKNPISAMKSLKNLTANVSKYKLTGRAKEIIDGFVQEVIL